MNRWRSSSQFRSNTISGLAQVSGVQRLTIPSLLVAVEQQTGSDDRCARVCSGVSKVVAGGLQSHDDNVFGPDVDVNSEAESSPSSPVAKKPCGRVH